MIGEVRSGSSFRGLVHYLVRGSAERGPRAPAWVELRNLVARDPETAVAEMRATASQNPRVKQPVFHLVLSPAPEDRLDRGQWRAVADRVLGELGLEGHQAVVALHVETGLPHLHVAINRVHPQTLRAWDRWRSKTRIEGVLRRVEREWGLRRVVGRLAEVERGKGRVVGASGRLTKGQRAQLLHRASEPRVARWRRELAGEFEAARSWSDLAVRLQVNGVHLEARGRGLVVSDGEVYVKASSIGRESSRGRLEARFGQKFAAWRADRERFAGAAEAYARYAHRPAGHPRAGAALRALRSAGESLGWRAAGRLAGPLAPAVGAVVSAGGRSGRSGWDVLLEARVAPALRRSRSWMEAEGRLRRYGVWLEGRGRGVVVTDGVRAMRTGDLGGDLARRRLEERFGEWSEWQRTREELLARARRLDRFEVGAGRREERWRRLVGLIEQAERRVERYEAAWERYRDAEERVRRVLRAELGERVSPAEVEDLVRSVRGAPEREIPALVRGRRSWAARWSRGRRELPEEVRRAIGDYRRLAEELVRTAPAARSAARRLRDLRRRATVLRKSSPRPVSPSSF